MPPASLESRNNVQSRRPCLTRMPAAAEELTPQGIDVQARSTAIARAGQLSPRASCNNRSRCVVEELAPAQGHVGPDEGKEGSPGRARSATHCRPSSSRPAAMAAEALVPLPAAMHSSPRSSAIAPRASRSRLEPQRLAQVLQAPQALAPRPRSAPAGAARTRPARFRRLLSQGWRGAVPRPRVELLGARPPPLPEDNAAATSIRPAGRTSGEVSGDDVVRRPSLLRCRAAARWVASRWTTGHRYRLKAADSPVRSGLLG